MNVTSLTSSEPSQPAALLPSQMLALWLSSSLLSLQSFGYHYVLGFNIDSSHGAKIQERLLLRGLLQALTSSHSAEGCSSLTKVMKRRGQSIGTQGYLFLNVLWVGFHAWEMQRDQCLSAWVSTTIFGETVL